MVRVLDEDPGLGARIPERSLSVAASVAVAPLMRLRKGPGSFLFDEPATHGHLGLLVLDGLLARHVVFGQIGSTEFVGPGDLLRPWVKPAESAEMVHVRWQVLVPTRLAALDREFANRVRPWPELTAALLDRATERVDSQLLQSALRQAKRVEDRLLLALWHFAGRWGNVGMEGRIVKLPNITGEVLATIVGARRQSVSTALTALTRRGAIHRRPDGSWIIPDRPPQLEHVERGSRASDIAADSFGKTA